MFYEPPVMKVVEVETEGLICVSDGTSTRSTVSWETEDWDED